MKKTIILLAGPFLISGCLSIQNHSGEEKQGISVQPMVEAYIEYPGPQAKWSGPASFLMHITARGEGNAEIAVSPPIIHSFEKESDRQPRVPASTSHNLSSASARERLGDLAHALEGSSSPFQGCMYPLRVRMIRAGGTLYEKQGCRGQNDWARAVSYTVDYFASAMEMKNFPEIEQKITTESGHLHSESHVPNSGTREPAVSKK